MADFEARCHRAEATVERCRVLMWDTPMQATSPQWALGYIDAMNRLGKALGEALGEDNDWCFINGRIKFVNRKEDPMK